MKLRDLFPKRLAIAAGLLIGATSGSLLAQNMTVTTGNVNNLGAFTFRDNNGQFNAQSTGAGVTFSGTGDVIFEGTDNLYADETGNAANGQGQSVVDRVYWRTIYSGSNGATQNVQARYYQSLTMEDTDAKDIPDQVYTDRTYMATGGNRVYAGTFYYDGLQSQNVWPENSGTGAGEYNNLAFQRAGQKVLLESSTASVAGNLTLAASNTGGFLNQGDMTVGVNYNQNAASPLVLDGDNVALGQGVLTLGTGIGYFGGTVDVNEYGQLIIPATGGANTWDAPVTVTLGDILIQDGASTSQVVSSGTLTLANDVNATLNMEANTGIDFIGDYANNFAGLTNQFFDISSTVRYLGGAQTVVASVSTHPYGNVHTGNAGDKTASGDVYMGGNLYVGLNAEHYLEMGASTLHMTTATASAGYNGLSEVGGALRRTVAVGQNTYTMNNNQTVVDFTAGTYNGYFEAAITRNTAPNLYDDETDVNRKITLDFDDNNWTATIRAAYRQDETDQGPWLATVNEGNLRFFENSPAEEQKVATGQAPTRLASGGANFGYVELAGITAATVQLPNAANLNGQFYATNDLVLRGGPTQVIAVNDGRWSNPNTWDEGREPYEFDDVLIPNGYTVHTGYRRTAVDGSTANGQILEGVADGTNPLRDEGLATTIVVEDGGGLMFGYVVGGAADEQNQNQVWNMIAGGTITIEGSNVGSAFVANETNLTTTVGDAVHYPGFRNFGVYLNNGATIRGQFQANTFNIDGGFVSNGGQIIVGD